MIDIQLRVHDYNTTWAAENYSLLAPVASRGVHQVSKVDLKQPVVGRIGTDNPSSPIVLTGTVPAWNAIARDLSLVSRLSLVCAGVRGNP
ncbi:hypothetical protein CHELA1G11_21194 [Hyphomicrobiales bacterium]|nr:hypothetical protein CHELA1G11_21194 [Hyphomicrobiales bacterium]CAH1693700.1 hypothetical protein CHELA1G2_21501 [Hyphomicrobiales bacterium]